MKKIRIFFNATKAGIVGVWRNKSMGLASIISTAAVLVILGLVLLVALNANVIMSDVQNRVDEIEVYIDDEATDLEIQAIEEEIESRPGIKEVVYKDKEDALEEMKNLWGEDAYILEGLEENNPLERSFLISVESIDLSEPIVEYIEPLDGVTNVIYYQETINRLVEISDQVRFLGLVIAFILMVISVVVISNTVKLTVVARQNEIEIMRYVGASNIMISFPFIIEGIIFGVIGALLGFFIIYSLYNFAYVNLREDILSLVSSHMINPEFFRDDFLIIFCTLGVVVGTVGSVFSIKKYLRA